MSKKVGLWIDHREAFVVYIPVEGEAVLHLQSEVEDHVHKGGGILAREINGAENRAEEKYKLHMGGFYELVAKRLREAGEVFIFGPGEAKGEFKKYLEDELKSKAVIEVETTDKMTENQIVAKVKKHFAPVIV